MMNMNKNDIDIKSTAMNLKLRRFCLKDIVLTSYLNSVTGVITFVDSAEYVWHVSSKYGRILSISADDHIKFYEWLKELNERPTAKYLHDHYRIILSKGIDYAMVFDWLIAMAQMYGCLSICKLSNFTTNEKHTFDNFFLPSDSPEQTIVQFDLYAESNDQNARL